MLKFPKTNTFADGLIERISTMLDETESEEQAINKEKSLSETMSQVRLVKNISKNPQSFLEISHVQKEYFQIKGR